MGDGDDRVAPQLSGVIHDTNSHGRFDLLIYEDGILAVKGNYVRTVLLAGGAGMGGASVGAVAGAVARSGYDRKQHDKLSERSRADLLGSHPANHFIARAQLAELTLKKRWYSHSLTINTIAEPHGRKYSWKPALNSYKGVRQTVLELFGTELVTCDP